MKRSQRLLPDYRGVIVFILFILASIEWALIYLHAYYPKQVHIIVNAICNELGIDHY